MNTVYLDLVRFDFDNIPIEYHKQYPFTNKDVFVMLGEIRGMSGHCVVAHSKTGQIHTGFHIDNFIPLTKEEL